MIWVIGLARAFALRPVLVAQEYVDLRYGLLFELRVPLENIDRVRRATDADRILAVPRRSLPTICIELVEPMDAVGLLGVRSRLRAIAITPDDEVSFVRALLAPREDDADGRYFVDYLG